MFIACLNNWGPFKFKNFEPLKNSACHVIFPDALLKTKMKKGLSLAIRKSMIINDPNHERYEIDTAFIWTPVRGQMKPPNHGRSLRIVSPCFIALPFVPRKAYYYTIYIHSFDMLWFVGLFPGIPRQILMTRFYKTSGIVSCPSKKSIPNQTQTMSSIYDWAVVRWLETPRFMVFFYSLDQL